VSWTPRIPGLTKQQCWDLDGSNVWPPSLITITEEEHGATNEAPRWDMYDPLDDWRLKSRPISNECGSKDYLFSLQVLRSTRGPQMMSLLEKCFT
jgi:hypothetical protein